MEVGSLNNCLIATMPIPPRAPVPNMPKDISDKYNEVYKKINRRQRNINPLGTAGFLRSGLTFGEKRQLKEINELYHTTPEYREYQRRLDEYHNSDAYKEYEKELKRWIALC